jgi:mRNA-degrading endonuclease toxin of MazEF toxin-antitoxin module
MMSLNTEGDAFGIWDKIGIPIRRRGEVVFRIRAPRDVTGSPVIQDLHVDCYIRGVSIKTADDAACLAHLTGRLTGWRLTSILLAVTITLLILAWMTAA